MDAFTALGLPAGMAPSVGSACWQPGILSSSKAKERKTHLPTHHGSSRAKNIHRHIFLGLRPLGRPKAFVVNKILVSDLEISISDFELGIFRSLWEA